jgi:hypothetical protein
MSHINVIEKYEEHRVSYTYYWSIIAAALLLVSLGIYVYLGSKAEGMLLKNNGNTRKRREKGA